MVSIATYLAAVWEILLEASPYVLFGFFVAGLLKGFLPADFVARHLGRGKTAPVFKAALFGIPLPLCSCGVIPAAAGLRQQGASMGATTSFLISTPETGVDSMAVTYALLDPIMTILRPLAAFVSAITAGLLVDALPEATLTKVDVAQAEMVHTGGHGMDEAAGVRAARALGKTDIAVEHAGCNGGCCCSEVPRPSVYTGWQNLEARFRSGMRFAFGELISDIGKWLLIGVFLAALITTFLPVSFIEQYVGDGFFGMVLMVLVGVPMYVCATASTPIAAALALKGLSPGAALVFLLAGPATNVATITVVARMLGKRVAVVYVASIAVVSVGMGLAVNWLYGFLGLSVSGWVKSTEVHEPTLIATLSALVLVALVLRSLLVQHLGRRGTPASSGCSCG